jgi:hypothetical protein
MSMRETSLLIQNHYHMIRIFYRLVSIEQKRTSHRTRVLVTHCDGCSWAHGHHTAARGHWPAQRIHPHPHDYK